MLDPDGIPEAVWTHEAGRNYLAAHRQLNDAARSTGDVHARSDSYIEVDPAQARAVLRNLHQFSLIAHDPHPARAGLAVQVHALVQRATRDEIDDEQLAGLTYAAAEALLGLWPEHHHDLDLYRNTTTLSEIARDTLYKPGTHPVFFRLL